MAEGVHGDVTYRRGNKCSRFGGMSVAATWLKHLKSILDMPVLEQCDRYEFRTEITTQRRAAHSRHLKKSFCV